jgi:hypothetical protein
MLIFNFADQTCDRALWHAVAEQLGLRGTLRDAHLVGRTVLTVVIHSSRRRPSQAPDGIHTLGHTDIFPCSDCNSGFLTATYLHLVFQAWLYQHQQESYLEDWTEGFCDRAAMAVLRLLGGGVMRGPKCRRFRSPAPSAWPHLVRRVRALVMQLQAQRGEALESRAVSGGSGRGRMPWKGRK